ncbi:MerR family transcriptional regulator [Thalassotalea ponticola]|uniref:MerR family transcriptional regulator n=1 Tax=Thalassotalea ponticola TaxID=1523392 RepID=UPI0025B5455A|nr:MerR family transcriptional regulator [Thalassotalea ponticola]MDN3653435.1 MerR family transcriptional regulator [Thalassotalea ponticola]
MYRISELASLVGLSRTALLYYEKLNLIKGKRLENGYRVYSDRDVQQIRLIQQLQSGGLTLAECKSCLESKLDKSVLRLRYDELDNEIKRKQKSLALLACLLGDKTSKPWHETLAEIAPDAHIDWLKVQGFDEKQALRVKWLSKDMNEHDKYMQDFMSVFETLEFWGPNSEDDTTKAFNWLNLNPMRILEVGCGKGNSTIVIAKLSNAEIVATDNEKLALEQLEDKIKSHGLDNRITTECVSMTELNFAKGAFDVIWAEASAYVMGVENALSKWKPLLKDGGLLVFSDLAWLTDKPSKESINHWKSDYPDIQTIETRKLQIAKAGYQLEHTFTVSEQAWKNYYEPLEERLHKVAAMMKNSQAIADIQNEVNLYKSHLGEFGYQFFIAKKL